MKKLFPVLCVLMLILTISHCFAQIKTQEAKLTDLPANAYKGKVVKSLSWTDKNGDNMLVLTEIAPFLSQKRKGEDDYYDAELYAYLYVKKGGTYQLLWKVTDFVRQCILDITTTFLTDALSVTDLDGNGIAETWLMYRLACRGDVSPSTMKLIMYEGDKKYAVRGTCKIVMGDESYGGEMNMDANFKNGLQVFREYAQKKWKGFEKEF
ncbi:M949_RS01915 family surface polysaccharide biosynthesis protein [Thermoflexibacter ruber]|uniref:Uncharacterized protein n=1 Tax=Thermoflexibacter ruber TaxID=1003 RepID=A0A1I2DFY5_9BACT|nr:hypothetical protein [Thermoflexibacter ruber]SFE79414.1 hypothetical protein SAMN04488541_10074 [Thermoflexibacter ruber]